MTGILIGGNGNSITLHKAGRRASRRGEASSRRRRLGAGYRAINEIAAMPWRRRAHAKFAEAAAKCRLLVLRA